METSAPRYAANPGAGNGLRHPDSPPSASVLGDAISAARNATERVRGCRFYLSETADRTFGSRPTTGNISGHRTDDKDVPPPAIYLRALLEQLHEEISALEAEAQRFGAL